MWWNTSCARVCRVAPVFSWVFMDWFCFVLCRVSPLTRLISPISVTCDWFACVLPNLWNVISSSPNPGQIPVSDGRRYFLPTFPGPAPLLSVFLPPDETAKLPLCLISERSHNSCDLQESAGLILFMSKTKIKTTTLHIQIYAPLSWKQIQKNAPKYKDQACFFSFLLFFGVWKPRSFPHTVHNDSMRYQTLSIHICKQARTFLHCN